MEETNMKKIIATVLAMVMALALCTTAFAATTYTLGSATGNELVEKTATNYVTRYVDKVDGKVYVVTTDATATELYINGVGAKIHLEEAKAENNFGKYTVVAKAVEAPAVGRSEVRRRHQRDPVCCQWHLLRDGYLRCR